MSAENFPRFLALAWAPGFDDPADGYHVTPGDPGGGTLGGVTEATWKACAATGIVSGELRDASREALQTVLRAVAWGDVCDALPAGVDVLVANGRMMTGYYPKLLQECLGFTGAAVDGVIGPDTIGTAHSRDARTLIGALTGTHEAYLRRLPTWAQFGNGWHRRIVEACSVALEVAAPMG